MGPHELLEKVVRTFEALKIPYLITGSMASMAYGEPRMTNDIDIVAGIRNDHVPGLIEAFPPDDYFVSADAIRDAITRQDQFNIVHPRSGLKIDIFIRGDSAFDESRFGRIRRLTMSPALAADFASPEDVILKKLLYYREGGSEKHLRDIAGILATSGEEIDMAYLAGWSQRLGVEEIWNAVRGRMRGRGGG